MIAVTNSPNNPLSTSTITECNLEIDKKNMKCVFVFLNNLFLSTYSYLTCVSVFQSGPCGNRCTLESKSRLQASLHSWKAVLHRIKTAGNTFGSVHRHSCLSKGSGGPYGGHSAGRLCSGGLLGACTSRTSRTPSTPPCSVPVPGVLCAAEQNRACSEAAAQYQDLKRQLSSEPSSEAEQLN